jgi:hypothetical protein
MKAKKRPVESAEKKLDSKVLEKLAKMPSNQRVHTCNGEKIGFKMFW